MACVINLKAAIFYASITGNTKFVAEFIKKGLEDSGNECDIFNIHHLKFDDYSKYDILGFGTPVFAFKEVNLVQRFMRDLPKMDKYAFIFCTSNGDPGNSLYNMSKSLKLKGIKVFDKASFIFPSSYTVWRKKVEKNTVKKSEIEKALAFGKNIAKNLDAVKQGKPLPHISWSLLKGIFGAFSSDNNLRFYLGTIRVNTEICTKCGLCSDICPSDAIILDPYPKISKKCTGCCGCINLCPVNALDSSKTKNKAKYKFDESLIEK